MCTPAHHVLCFSTVPILLETRHAILSRHFRVISVASPEQFLQLAPAMPVDVAVFCHALPLLECQLAVSTFRVRWPNGKILALHTGAAPSHVPHPDRNLRSLDGPAALLQEVRSLLPSFSMQETVLPPGFALDAPQPPPAHW